MSIKYFCLCLFLTVFLSLVPSYGNTNLLTNPGFESGTTGWTGRSCSISTVQSPVHSGSSAGRAYERTDTWQGIKQSLLGKMKDGETYQISGWVRLEDANDGTVTVSLEQTDDDGTRYINVSSASVTDSNWVQLEGEFSLYVTGTLKTLDIYFEGPAAGVSFFVDDVNVYNPEAGGTDTMSRNERNDAQLIEPDEGWFPAPLADVKSPLGLMQCLNVYLRPLFSSRGSIRASAFY